MVLEGFKKHRHIVIGLGEIGSSVRMLLQEHYDVVDFVERNKLEVAHDDYHVMHVCIPYSENFDDIVIEYKKKYITTGIVIIHSTVKVGTSRRLDCVSSPVRGTHPNILEGLKLFVKYFAACDLQKAERAADYFRFMNIKCIYHNNPDESEAAKLWDTTQYGFMIILNKWMKRWCEKNKLDFDYIYTEWNRTYNRGYTDLNNLNVLRPTLKYVEGEIGGHCVLPNCNLLDSTMAQFILLCNEHHKDLEKTTDGGTY